MGLRHQRLPQSRRVHVQTCSASTGVFRVTRWTILLNHASQRASDHFQSTHVSYAVTASLNPPPSERTSRSPDRCDPRIQKNYGARGLVLGHRDRVKQVLADSRGVEILVDESAAEEQQLPDLDYLGLGSGAGRDLDCGRGEGNARVGRAASADHRTVGQALVRHEDVGAQRSPERTGQGGAAFGKAVGHDDQLLGAYSIGTDNCQVEWDAICEAATRVLGLDVDGGGRGSAARVYTRRVEDEGVGGVADGGKVSARRDSGGEVDTVLADAQVIQRRTRR